MLIGVLAAIGIYLYVGARSSLERSLKRELSTVAVAVAREVDAGAFETARLERIVIAYGDLSRDLLVTDGSGAIIARAGRPLSLGGPPLRSGIGGSGVDEAAGVVWASERLASERGAAVALASTDSIDQTLSEIAAVLSAGLLVSLVAVGLLVAWVTRRTLAPLGRLRAASERLAGGDLSARVVETGGGDELGEVGRAFNRMAARLEESFDHERRFLADASHELRTPITALGGELDVLERAKGVEAAELRRSMRIQVDRMGRLVEDLLTLARLDALGPRALRRIECDLMLIARDVVEEARRLPTAAGIQLRLEGVPHVPLHGDPDALHRLLLNLVVNGLQHAGAGGWVAVTIQLHDGRVLCEVRDSGPGIARGELDHIFDRFRRGDAGEDKERHVLGMPGTGLGLAIALSIADAHGGQLSVRNEGGAAFTIMLPAADGRL